MIEAAGLVSMLASTVGTGTVAGAPLANDVDRLRLALSEGGVMTGTPEATGLRVTPSSGVAPSGTVGAPTAVAVQESAASSRTLGEAILQGLQSASNDINQAWRSTGEVLAKPDITVADVLRVQSMLLQSAVQYELVGKAVSKSTQSLENILKTQ